MIRLLLCLMAVGVTAAVATSAGAADDVYPSHPVRLLVPFAPGGGADALSRIITPK